MTGGGTRPRDAPRPDADARRQDAQPLDAQPQDARRQDGQPQDELPPHEPAPADARAAAVARWLHLTRVVLPGMAATHRWPIRRDHCFMRVCLDVAIGAPWHHRVRRPAIRHLDDAQLARAIDLARRVAADPASLPGLNRESLALRGKGRG